MADRTKNTAIDLHNILFSSLENLSDDELLDNPEKLERELKRTKGICDISSQIISLATLQLSAEKLVDSNEIKSVPRLLT